MLKIKYPIGCLIVALLYLSCEKKESFDITGEVAVKFFTNSETPGSAPINSKSYSAVNIPDATGAWLNLSSNLPAVIKFPVFATKPTSSDVIVSAELDNSLIAEYNSKNKTNYQPFPVGVLNTTGLAAVLYRGTTRSGDSITITTNAGMLSSLTADAYMAPIRLSTVSKPEVGQITTNSGRVTYIVMDVEHRLIKYLATTADVQGALITPRTSWTALFNPALTTTGSIFDGSTTTFSRWSASPGQLDVDIQTTRNVTGIRLYSANSATYVPTQIDVYLSTDGINYSLIGSPLKANLTYASSYNYILFYKAIPARYIRLKLSYVTNTNTQNYRVVEFDVYAN